MRGTTVTCAVALWLAGATPAAAGEVKAAVAANFADVAQQLAPLFYSRSGHTLVASFGSSGKLFSQIENGAPFEVLLSADSDRPKALEAKGDAISGSRFTYAVGKLALWSSDPGRVDSRGEVLKGSFSRLALANPRSAPYGAAAVQAMIKLGYLERLRPRFVQGESIAQAFQFVATGNAELGFVALAQVKALPAGEAGSSWVVPQELYDPIEQDAVLLKRGEGSAAAKAFLAFLRSPEAKAVIRSFGYETR